MLDIGGQIREPEDGDEVQLIRRIISLDWTKLLVIDRHIKGHAIHVIAPKDVNASSIEIEASGHS